MVVISITYAESDGRGGQKIISANIVYLSFQKAVYKNCNFNFTYSGLLLSSWKNEHIVYSTISIISIYFSHPKLPAVCRSSYATLLILVTKRPQSLPVNTLPSQNKLCRSDTEPNQCYSDEMGGGSGY